MKRLIAMIALYLLSHAYAETHPDVKVELKFDKNYQHTHAFKFHQDYLVVVPEDWSFPSRTNLGRAQKVKFEKALDILEEVLNSEEFKMKVLSYQRSDGNRLYQKNYLWRDSTQRLSNEDVYQIIMEGREKMIPGTLGEMNINSYVKVCRWWEKVGVWCRKVIGSTSPSSSKFMKLNWKFYRKFETHQMVSNIVHEWIHLLGFLHGNENMREEVPYVVGAIAGEVAKGILARE